MQLYVTFQSMSSGDPLVLGTPYASIWRHSYPPWGKPPSALNRFLGQAGSVDVSEHTSGSCVRLATATGAGGLVVAAGSVPQVPVVFSVARKRNSIRVFAGVDEV
jgi:hypothetical protein